jgi:membrane protein DedA with SNARE-associated domain
MEEQILSWFAQFVYQPYIVYGAILGFMTICALGVPIPEEVIIISAGLVGHMALNPIDYPPPYPGAHAVDPYTLAFVAFGSVIITDYMIFSMGKFFGGKIMRSKRFEKFFTVDKVDKITLWAKKYGFMAPGVFRFIPGVRFPGHLMCGALGVPGWAFLLVDGGAAVISVPTQVLLVSFYGKDILNNLKEFKLYFFGGLAVLLLLYFIKKYFFTKSLPST